jgi:hypothetical protein
MRQGRHTIDIRNNEAQTMLKSPIPLNHFHKIAGINKKVGTGYYKHEYNKLKPIVENYNELIKIVEQTKFYYQYTNEKTEPNIYIYYGIIEALDDMGLTSTLIGRIVNRNRSTITTALQTIKNDQYRISQIIKQDVKNHIKQLVMQKIGKLEWKAN